MKCKIYYIILSLLLLCISGLNFVGKTYSVSSRNDDKGPIIVAVDSTYENYFVQRGEPKGYQLELLQNYSNHLKTSFQIIVTHNTDEQLELLRNNIVDFIVFSQGASNLYDVLANNSDLRASIPLDDKRHSTWITCAGNENRISSINLWAGSFCQTQDYRFLLVKYFDNTLAKPDARLSAYDHWFRKYSEQIGWDWRLLAALTYQESKFNPMVTSPRGAFGLMQLMPNTAASLNIDDIDLPENNIRAGVKLLNRIKKYVVQTTENQQLTDEELLKFVLSSYNAGIGRINDCRRFAESLGYDPNNWEQVKLAIPLMSQPEYYNGENIALGKFKGVETVNYVDEVLTRYQHYKNLVPEDPGYYLAEVK